MFHSMPIGRKSLSCWIIVLFLYSNFAKVNNRPLESNSGIGIKKRVSLWIFACWRCLVYFKLCRLDGLLLLITWQQGHSYSKSNWPCIYLKRNCLAERVVQPSPAAPRKVSTASSIRSSSSQMSLMDEMVTVQEILRQKQKNLEITKTPDVYINKNSTPNEVISWLKEKKFSRRQVPHQLHSSSKCLIYERFIIPYSSSNWDLLNWGNDRGRMQLLRQST